MIAARNVSSRCANSVLEFGTSRVASQAVFWAWVSLAPAGRDPIATPGAPRLARSLPDVALTELPRYRARLHGERKAANPVATKPTDSPTATSASTIRLGPTRSRQARADRSARGSQLRPQSRHERHRSTRVILRGAPICAPQPPPPAPDASVLAAAPQYRPTRREPRQSQRIRVRPYAGATAPRLTAMPVRSAAIDCAVRSLQARGERAHVPDAQPPPRSIARHTSGSVPVRRFAPRALRPDHPEHRPPPNGRRSTLPADEPQDPCVWVLAGQRSLDRGQDATQGDLALPGSQLLGGHISRHAMEMDVDKCVQTSRAVLSSRRVQSVHAHTRNATRSTYSE